MTFPFERSPCQPRKLPKEEVRRNLPLLVIDLQFSPLPVLTETGHKQAESLKGFVKRINRWSFPAHS